MSLINANLTVAQQMMKNPTSSFAAFNAASPNATAAAFDAGLMGTNNAATLKLVSSGDELGSGRGTSVLNYQFQNPATSLAAGNNTSQMVAAAAQGRQLASDGENHALSIAKGPVSMQATSGATGGQGILMDSINPPN